MDSMAVSAVGKRYTVAERIGGGEVLLAYSPPPRRAPRKCQVEVGGCARMARTDSAQQDGLPRLRWQCTGTTLRIVARRDHQNVRL
ncbi:hypothetical protein ACCAA_120013 [Candidatus Accumulibacter aalborgensis]|uniref:Uncharacterized protein n=1 Tax=Candidatus Accumulibacter aalborgensis TaxID=1860102 RepID=A0A1A8XJ03_9PROT|nr:hypothetical protein ACCAA_120013 [Candidatus Accumulibacter aalborgensis]